MKSFVISLSKIDLSIYNARKMLKPLSSFGFNVALFEGTYGNEAEKLFKQQTRTLHPYDHLNNPTKVNRKTTSEGVKGCFYSHYRLWKKCVELNEPIWIFEDDVIFIREYYPVDFDDVLIVVLGSWLVNTDMLYVSDSQTPSALNFTGPCLPGTPGYAIKPHAAKKLLDEYKNTYLPSDVAVKSSLVDIKIHSHLMGRALTEKDGKESLTYTRYWENESENNISK
jgi:glycosyl transferase family 25